MLIPDRENVINAWKDVLSRDPLDAPWDLIDDTLALLKELEPVVRCKDCKHSTLTFNGDCKYCDLYTDDNGFLVERHTSGDWYCADAERR